MSYKIAIDAGHGGKDPGAVANGLQEKNITLYIALEVAKILRAAGQYVILTRDTDRFIDLNSQRTPIADVSVSIHVNKSPSNISGKGKGLETWVSLFNQPTKSKELGQNIQDSILKHISFHNRGLKTQVNSQGNADLLYMLRKPKGIAVLVECGFIDSPIDSEILKSENNLKKIAQGIASGIIQYLVKEVIDVALEQWMIDGGRTALKYLEKQGLILNAPEWSKEEKLGSATPQYLTWMMLQRLDEKIEGKTKK